MRNNLVVIFCALLLVSCASPLKSLTYREQLDIYKNMKIRLYKIAVPLEIAAAEFCPRTGIDAGVTYHRLSDYPEKMRAVANSYWELGEEDKILYQQNTSHQVNCHMPIELEYANHINAWTDGENIYITPSLLDEVDNLSLALIIAHELGHIVLNHAEQEQSEKLEREADRFALFVLARAKLDYRKAALQDVASRPPHISEGQTYLDTIKRADYFREVVAEIEKLQAADKALVP